MSESIDLRYAYTVRLNALGRGSIEYISAPKEESKDNE